MKISYIGGLNCGKRAVGLAVKRLSEQYPEAKVRGFTWSETQRMPDIFEQQARDSDIRVAQSVGALALASLPGKSNSENYVYGGPLPVARRKLLGRAVLKTVSMVARPNRYGRIRDVYTYLASSACELITHPIANLRPLVTGALSHFDSRQAFGIDTQLIYGSDDEFYSSELGSDEDVTILDGMHHDSIMFGRIENITHPT